METYVSRLAVTEAVASHMYSFALPHNLLYFNADFPALATIATAGAPGAPRAAGGAGPPDGRAGAG
jgi:hypothetical protein